MTDFFIGLKLLLQKLSWYNHSLHFAGKRSVMIATQWGQMGIRLLYKILCLFVNLVLLFEKFINKLTWRLDKYYTNETGTNKQNTLVLFVFCLVPQPCDFRAHHSSQPCFDYETTSTFLELVLSDQTPVGCGKRVQMLASKDPPNYLSH